MPSKKEKRVVCPGCYKLFGANSGMQLHWNNSPVCLEVYLRTYQSSVGDATAPDPPTQEGKEEEVDANGNVSPPHADESSGVVPFSVLDDYVGGTEDHARQANDEDNRQSPDANGIRSADNNRRSPDANGIRSADNADEEAYEQDSNPSEEHEESDVGFDDAGHDAVEEDGGDDEEEDLDDIDDEDEVDGNDDDDDVGHQYFFLQHLLNDDAADDDDEEDDEDSEDNDDDDDVDSEDNDDDENSEDNDVDDDKDSEDNDDDDDGVIQHLLNLHKDHEVKGYGCVPITPDFEAKLDLLNILSKPGVPKGLFDKVWNWAKLASHRKVSFDDGTTRDSLIKSLYQRYDMSRSIPKTDTLKLPSCGRLVKVVVHDFIEQLYSLLSDKDLMRPENLIFGHEDSPFQAPPSRRTNNYTISDIDDGTLYRKAYRQFVQAPGRDVVCPIILFIDKTHIDEKGNLTLEPVTFSLGILTKEARTLPHAWRPLGYMNNQKQMKGEKMTPLNRATDYHYVLSHILRSFSKAQKKEGIAWDLSFKGKLHPCVFKIPVLCVMGDSEGHNKLCGHFTSSTKVKSLCRSCDCPAEETGKAESLVVSGRKFTRASDIRALVEARDEESLKEKSYYNLRNAFWDIKFCDDVRGINGSCPGELLHAVQHGLFLYFTHSLFDMKRLDKQSHRRSVNESPGEAAEEECDAVEPRPKRTRQLKAFSALQKENLDYLAMHVGRRLQHQSDRQYCRAFFSNGIRPDAKKYAQREGCVLVLLLLILVSYRGDEFFDDYLGTEPTTAIAQVIEHLLLLENFLQEPKFTVGDLKLLERFIPVMMKKYHSVVQREDGLGENILKFHLPLHFANDLDRVGPGLTFDSKVGESNHKPYKSSARRTQKVSSKLELQTAVNFHESLAISRSVRELHSKKRKDLTDESVDPKASLVGKKYFVTASGMFSVSQKTIPVPAQWCDTVLMDEVTEFIQGKVLVHLPEQKRVYLFTSATRSHGSSRQLYRSDPNYETGYRAGWHDWANVYWGGEDGVIPFRIFIFMEITDASFGGSLNQLNIDGPGIYAIGQSARQSIYSSPRPENQSQDETFHAHVGSRLVYWVPLETQETSDRPKLSVVDVAGSFDSTVIAIPYVLQPDESLEDEPNEVEWLVLEPRTRWLQVFRVMMEEALKSN